MPGTPPLVPADIELPIDNALATEVETPDFKDALATSLVKQTFDFYSTFRTTNHDPRWIAHDALYFGYVAPKVWMGTNIPRANLPLSLTFAKVESALPSVMQSIFYTGGESFQVQAENPGDKQAAVEWHDIMSYVIEHPNEKFGATAYPDFMEILREVLLYGNSGARLCWNARENTAQIEHVDIRDFYIDPLTPSPSVDGARSVVERRIMPVDQVHELIKSDKRFKQLSLLDLQGLSTITPACTADTTRRMQEAFRAVNFDPGYYNWIPNPADRGLEVLIYYSKKRIIYTLNRQTTIYNEVNPYGFIPLSFAPCFPVPGRFYAQSIADVTEGFQRYSEALMNGHLDEVSLALNPPRQISRDSQLSPTNQKWFPGSTIMADATQSKNPLLQPQASLTNVMGDIQMMGTFSDMVSGVNGIGMGVPKAGNANRTATGMELQSQGNTMRLLPIVLGFEYYFFTPLLYKLYEMIRMHSKIDAGIPALNGEKETYKVSGAIITKKCQFKMLASTRMLTQQRLAEIVPFILQSMMQGPFVQGLNAANATIDYMEISRMIQDATGTAKAYQLVRPLNEQELAQKNQPPPEVVADAQKTQADLTVRTNLMAMKNESAEKIAAMKQGEGGNDLAIKQQEMQMKLQESAQKLQHSEQEAQLEMAMKQLQIQAEQQMSQAKLQAQRAEQQQKAQGRQYEMALKAQSANLDLQTKQATQATMVQEAEEKRKINRQAGEQQLSLRKMAADAKLQNEKTRAKEAPAKKKADK